ncbi:hypothetical protein [Nibribacter koreensis]|uniref:Lipocalin-like domain-containing protein n=1 Tax=Nibribacter koreensis TaxID=1084519 RepID=A0ABP8FF97_9BACT
MRKSLNAFLLLSCLWACSSNDTINPTGSYVLKAKELEGGEKGPHGELQVKLLDKNTAAISFFLTVGYPSYNSGSFVDTLTYQEGKIVYSYQEEGEPKCSVTFTFTDSQVSMKQAGSDMECGFGNGVYADVSMTKTSSGIPVIKDYWDQL